MRPRPFRYGAWVFDCREFRHRIVVVARWVVVLHYSGACEARDRTVGCHGPLLVRYHGGLSLRLLAHHYASRRRFWAGTAGRAERCLDCSGEASLDRRTLL